MKNYLLFKVGVHVVQYLHVFLRDDKPFPLDRSLECKVHVVEIDVAILVGISESAVCERLRIGVRQTYPCFLNQWSAKTGAKNPSSGAINFCRLT